MGVVALAAGDPGKVSAYDLGNRYFLQQRYPLALTQYERAVAQAPNASWAPEAQFFIGQCLLRMGQKARAVAAFETTLQRYPTSRRASDAHVAVADIYASLGRWRDATDHLNEAAKAPPGQPAGADGHYGLGVLYMEPGNPDRSPAKAIEQFQSVIGGWPTSDKVPLAYLGMGEAHLALNQPDGAAKIAQEIIRKYPQSHWEAAGRTLLASTLTVQGHPDQAQQQQQRAAEDLAPQSPLNTQTQAAPPPRFWVENFNRQTLPVPGPAGLAVQADSMSSDRNRLSLRGSVLIQAPPDTALGRPFTLRAASGWIDTPGGVVSCSGSVIFDSSRPVPGSPAVDRIRVEAAAFTVLIAPKQATARGDAVLQRWLPGRFETARGEQIVISLSAGTYRIEVPHGRARRAK